MSEALKNLLQKHKSMLASYPTVSDYIHQVDINDKVRSSLLKPLCLNQNPSYGPSINFIVDPPSSGEESEEDADKLTGPTIKDVMESVFDTRSIEIIKHPSSFPKGHRHSLLFCNLDKTFTAQQMNETLSKLAQNASHILGNMWIKILDFAAGSISISMHGVTRCAFVEFERPVDAKAINDYYLQNHHIFKNAAKDAIKVYLAVDKSQLEVTNWIAVILRNVPDCTPEVLMKNCSAEAHKVLYAEPPRLIKGQFCSLVRAETIEAAEKICKKLNNYVLNPKYKIKAHIHPLSNLKRDNPEKSHHYLFANLHTYMQKKNLCAGPTLTPDQTFNQLMLKRTPDQSSAPSERKSLPLARYSSYNSTESTTPKLKKTPSTSSVTGSSKNGQSQAASKGKVINKSDTVKELLSKGVASNTENTKNQPQLIRALSKLLEQKKEDQKQQQSAVLTPKVEQLQESSAKITEETMEGDESQHMKDVTPEVSSFNKADSSTHIQVESTSEGATSQEFINQHAYDEGVKSYYQAVPQHNNPFEISAIVTTPSVPPFTKNTGNESIFATKDDEKSDMDMDESKNDHFSAEAVEKEKSPINSTSPILKDKANIAGQAEADKAKPMDEDKEEGEIEAQRNGISKQKGNKSPNDQASSMQQQKGHYSPRRSRSGSFRRNKGNYRSYQDRGYYNQRSNRDQREGQQNVSRGNSPHTSRSPNYRRNDYYGKGGHYNRGGNYQRRPYNNYRGNYRNDNGERRNFDRFADNRKYDKDGKPYSYGNRYNNDNRATEQERRDNSDVRDVNMMKPENNEGDVQQAPSKEERKDSAQINVEEKKISSPIDKERTESVSEDTKSSYRYSRNPSYNYEKKRDYNDRRYYGNQYRDNYRDNSHKDYSNKESGYQESANKGGQYEEALNLRKKEGNQGYRNRYSPNREGDRRFNNNYRPRNNYNEERKYNRNYSYRRQDSKDNNTQKSRSPTPPGNSKLDADA